jgi:hypothetical protein
VARTRTTKKLAQRIDLNYFKRPTPLKRLKFWLSMALPAIALVWIAGHGFARDSRVYSSGRMSAAHAVLERECAACHVQTAGTFSAKASDSACLSCHDGPMHHVAATNARGCATCHSEHRGRANIAAVGDESCAPCHRDLKSSSGPVRYATHIESFEQGHPDVRALRETGRDPGTIRVNHAIHMRPIRRAPQGPNVQLECRDCHRSEAQQTMVYGKDSGPGGAATNWTYADINYLRSETTYTAPEETPAPADTLPTYRPRSGGELMAPVKFQNACAGCHSLAFDKRFNEVVPHDTPEVVHAFLVKKFSQYIAAHPAELRESVDAGRDLTGRPVPAAVRLYTLNEWVSARIADAEELLWRKTCKQCHALEGGAGQHNLPVIEPARTTRRWMPHAKFDHDAHQAFACVSCHEKALSSTEAGDILLPGIATCKTCHAPGPEHAESRCFECHTYHDWAKRKEVKPTFLLPALRTGGRGE